MTPKSNNEEDTIQMREAARKLAAEMREQNIAALGSLNELDWRDQPFEYVLQMYDDLIPELSLPPPMTVADARSFLFRCRLRWTMRHRQRRDLLKIPSKL